MTIPAVLQTAHRNHTSLDNDSTCPNRPSPGTTSLFVVTCLQLGHYSSQHPSQLFLESSQRAEPLASRSGPGPVERYNVSFFPYPTSCTDALVAVVVGVSPLPRSISPVCVVYIDCPTSRRDTRLLLCSGQPSPLLSPPVLATNMIPLYHFSEGFAEEKNASPRALVFFFCSLL